MAAQKLTDADHAAMGVKFDATVGDLVAIPRPGYDAAQRDAADGFAKSIEAGGAGLRNTNGNGSLPSGLDKATLSELALLNEHIRSYGATISNIDSELRYFDTKRQSIETQPDYGSELDALLGGASTKTARLRKLQDLVAERSEERQKLSVLLSDCQARYNALAAKLEKQARESITASLRIVKKSLETANHENDLIDATYWTCRDAGLMLSPRCPVVDKFRPLALLENGKRRLVATKDTSVDVWAGIIRGLGWRL